MSHLAVVLDVTEVFCGVALENSIPGAWYDVGSGTTSEIQGRGERDAGQAA